MTTLGFLKPFSELYAFGEEAPEKVCPTAMLRFVNLVFAVANAYLIFLINALLNKSMIQQEDLSLRLDILSTISLASFPCLFFFNFLFYTDPGSLFFVLLMYFHHLNNQDVLASVFGLISLLFRQTNIVWVLFVAANASFEILRKNWSKLSKKTTRGKAFQVVMMNLLLTCGGYIVTGIAFLAFLLINRGIVLGDKTAHEVSFNIPQMFYFFGFCCFFGLTIILKSIASFGRFLLENKLLFLLMSTGTGFLLRTMSTAHPYLLADNRHYTFYVWKRILNPSNILLDCSLPIVFVFGAWSLNHSLSKRDFTWKSLFLLSTAISLVPQKLLEFRYFVVPFVLWRLNVGPLSPFQVVLELILNSVVNMSTIYVFLFRPFVWPHEPYDIQRFMW